MDLKLLFDSFGVTWRLFGGPLGLLRASGRLPGSEWLPGAVWGAPLLPRGSFWEPWGSPGLHFGSFGIPQDRFLGALGGSEGSWAPLGRHPVPQEQPG